MSKLFHVIEVAARDARRAEALMHDAESRRALQTDPEGALQAFELHVRAIADETGDRKGRNMRRERGVRAVRPSPLT
jgi:hypothetical protein